MKAIEKSLKLTLLLLLYVSSNQAYADAKGKEARLNYAVQQAVIEAKSLQLEQVDPEFDLVQKVRDNADQSAFQKFRKLHKILVFPKDSGLTEDDRRSDEKYLGNQTPEQAKKNFDPDTDAYGVSDAALLKPSEYWITAKYLDSCGRLKKITSKNQGGLADPERAQFKNKHGYKMGFFFDRDEKTQPNKTDACAVLWIRLKASENTVASRRAGEVGSIFLYLDSQYKTYGISTWTYSKDRDRDAKYEDIKADYSSSVGHPAQQQAIQNVFSTLPVELPNLYILSRLAQVGGNNTVQQQTVAQLNKDRLDDAEFTHTITEARYYSPRNKADEKEIAEQDYQEPNFPADPYLNKILGKAKFYGNKGAACRKKALLLKYQLRFGKGQQVVGWCKGDALPQYIENDSSLTVLVKKPKNN